MALEKYIAELLYRYHCVVVPDFGAFLTQVKSAVIDEVANTLYPPSKTLSFNAQLKSNDGLLVSYMAKVEGHTYDEMLLKVQELAENWKNQLVSGERLILEDIGELRLNGNEEIVFKPSNKINFLTSSFGLSPFVSAPVTREVLKEKVESLEEKIPFVFTPERKERAVFRPYLKYAAILLLAFSTGITGYRLYDETKNTRQLVQEEVEQTVSKHIQQATFFDTAPLELPTVTLDIITKKKNVRMHHVVAGAFRFKKNANRKIRQLKQKGFNPSYLGINNFGLHMVAYDSFSDAKEALQALREIKRTQSPDAWLKSEK